MFNQNGAQAAAQCCACHSGQENKDILAACAIVSHTGDISHAALQRLDLITTEGKESRVSVDVRFSALVFASNDRVLVVPEPPSRPYKIGTVSCVIGILVHVVRREGLADLFIQRITSVSSGPLHGQLIGCRCFISDEKFGVASAV